MKVNEFIEGFKNANDKEKYVKKHVVRTYVNYEDKVSEAHKIADNAFHINGTNNGERMFSFQTANRYLLFILSIFNKYTDIEFGENYLSDFNILEEYNISSYVVNIIGADYERYKTVLDMVCDDMVRNERDIIPYIERKIEALAIIMNETFENVLQEKGDDLNGKSG